MPPIRFAALGHVTNDRLEGRVFPGGSALYAGLAAAQLGALVRLITSFGRDFVGADLLSSSAVQLEATWSDRTTFFEAADLAGRRGWRVLDQAAPLTHAAPDADVLFACPVLDEVKPSAIAVPPGVMVGAGLQGWLRRRRSDGVVEPLNAPELSFLAGCKAVFCSDEDLGGARAPLTALLCRLAEIAVVTEGPRGALLYMGNSVYRVHPCPAKEVDPTGAGDTFAACFLLDLARGRNPLDAAARAAVAASIAVEGRGPSALGSLASRLPQRLAWYRRHVPAPSQC